MNHAESERVVTATLGETIALHERVRGADHASILAAAQAITSALKTGGKLLAFGNGGSAADAQHVAAELVGRFRRVRPPLAAIALTTDTSILTSIGNDEGYDRVFARQIEALGRKGDVALGITTSGTSPNVVLGLEAAAARGPTPVERSEQKDSAYVATFQGGSSVWMRAMHAPDRSRSS